MPVQWYDLLSEQRPCFLISPSGITRALEGRQGRVHGSAAKLSEDGF